MKKIFIVLIAVAGLFNSCIDVLDKRDLGSISNENVWKDPVLVTAYLNSIYTFIPAWDYGLADATDEATGGGKWTDGTVTPDDPITYSWINPISNESTTMWYWPYADIRYINTFLQNVNDRSITTIDEKLAGRLAMEARFARAYVYFELVKRYGGVPLITKPQSKEEDLMVSRNSTLECFNFIFDELTACINELPETYPAVDLGRVTKGAAQAFYGRVSLFRASKQFNPSNNAALWQAAYEANKKALDDLKDAGHELQADYGKLFLDEMNKEVIFAIRYVNPGRTQKRDAAVRPIKWSQNNTGGCHPIQEAVDRFPTTDGKKFTINDLKQGEDIANLWKNRDNRFYATIVYQESDYFNEKMQLNENAENDYAYGKNIGSKTGYYSKKGIDQTLSITDCQTSGTDYIDIRLAEVMLNYAEAAAELGKSSEAFAMLKEIRARAGIKATVAGDPELQGKEYGLNPNMSKTEMIQAVREERFVEFMFEQKRLWDLRRWMIHHEVCIGQNKRHALVMNKQKDNSVTWYLFDRDNTPMKNDVNMYFQPILRKEMTNNPNLEQTKGWEGGTFDPQAGL